MGTKKLENVLIPFGMFGTLCFLAYIIIGASLLPASGAATGVALRAAGMAKSSHLTVFAVAYGLGMLAFSAGMLMRAYRAYNATLLAAYVVFINLQVLLVFGFAMFPLNGTFSGDGMDKVHAVIFGVVSVAINAFAYLAGFGYHKQRDRKRLGIYCMVLAVIIMIINISNIIFITLRIELLGIGERAVVYALMGMIFPISHVETFFSSRYNRIIKEN